MVDTQELTLLLVVIVVLALIVFALGYLSLRRLKDRRSRLASEVENSPALKADRAYNQARLARTEADILERSGVDVRRARRLVDEAEASIGRRDYDGGIAQARAAHELLVRLKNREGPSAAPQDLGALAPATETEPPQSGRAPMTVPEGPLGPPGPTGGGLLMAPDGEVPLPEAPASRLPKNRAESKFQLTILDEELASAKADAPARGEAEALGTEAHAAYERGDYNEALRTALRARRKLGARLETLPPAAAAPGGSPRGDVPLKSGGSAGGACPRCGRATRPTDQFCRSCGAPTKPAGCPRCGRPLEAGDGFCAACGAPVG